MSARTLARWAIGLVLLVALVVTFDVSAIGTRLAAANLPVVVVAVAGLSALHLLGAATWRILARRVVGITLAWWPTVRLYYAGQAIGGFTPANLGSDAYRVVAVRGLGDGTRSAVLPITIQRVTSYLAVSLVGAVALLVASRPSGFVVGVVIGALVLSTVTVGVISLLSVRPGPLRPLRDRLLGGGEHERRGLASGVAIGLGLGLVFHVLGVALTFALVLSVEPAAASLAALAAVALARVSILVPLTPSGLGIHEAALALLFVGIGLPAESALAASLLARLSFLLTAALGAASLIMPDRHRADANPHRPVDSVGV
jgi:uncharacterized membrane protein YbhN (UPF0104 family)